MGQALRGYFPRAKQAKGIIAVLCAGLLCMLLDHALAGRIVGMSALTLAIIIGMILGNTVYVRYSMVLHDGVTFAKGQILRMAIVLYGFKLTMTQVESVGMSAIVCDAIIVTVTFLLACWFGMRWFKIDRQTVMLVGAGASICGAAAVIATEPVVKAQAHKVTIAVATVVVFGTLGMLLYPFLYRLGWLQPWLSAQEYGIYTGSTVHEVAQVVAAGNAVSSEAGNIAVVTKMIRVMMLAPFLFLLSLALTPAEAGQHGWAAWRVRLQHVSIPWFALLFIVVVLLHSWLPWPPSVVSAAVMLDNLLLTMAMFALGLTTHVGAIRQAGIKPLLLGAVIFVWLVLGGALVNLLVL